MKKAYKIPYHNMTEGNNQSTLKKTIKFLSDQYLVDWEVMETTDRIDLLETIMNLTHIYLNMRLEE